MRSMRDRLGRTERLALGLGALLAGAALAGAPRPAAACGGLFCNNSAGQQVNQAAERILFTKEADGTVWATIEILYEGRADRFAWLLPVEGEPEVQLGATRTLDVLQQNTNPTYTLNTTFEGCGGGGCSMGCAAASPTADSGGFGFPGDVADGGTGPVDVLRQERLGPYDYVLLSVAEDADDPAAEAIRWLQDNGFDVFEDQAATLRPYLMSGQNLLAFRLAKDADTGAIRPLRIEFGMGLPAIPIRPTAVAANDDMPIMVFVLGEARAVPVNYRLVEFNDALLDWINPQNNYMQLVSAAIDEAMGQAFVTEYAGASDLVRGQIVDGPREYAIDTFESAVDRGASSGQLVANFISGFPGWEGYAEVLGAHTTLDEATIAGLVQCATDGFGCPSVDVESILPDDFDADAFVADVRRQVIDPVQAGEDMVQRHPYLTRLLTTMDPEEMTLDPMFDFNDELEDVSNQHTMTRTVRCNADGDDVWGGRTEADLPVQGRDQTTWPYADPRDADMPAALRILRAGPDGTEVVADNREAIEAAVLGGGSDEGCRLLRSQAMQGSLLVQMLLLLGWLALRRRDASGR